MAPDVANRSGLTMLNGTADVEVAVGGGRGAEKREDAGGGGGGGAESVESERDVAESKSSPAVSELLEMVAAGLLAQGALKLLEDI